jgi:hypothetical protein
MDRLFPRPAHPVSTHCGAPLAQRHDTLAEYHFTRAKRDGYRKVNRLAALLIWQARGLRTAIVIEPLDRLAPKFARKINMAHCKEQ